MSRAFVRHEALDFAAHGSAAFVLLFVAWMLGCTFTPAGTIAIAWGLGFVREITEWQDGGRHPFTAAGILDQVGWIYGGLCFILAT